MKTGRRKLLEWQKKILQQAVEAILTGYSQGTRFGIHMDQDGLLAAGVPGLQLTWMDSKIGDWVVTPRTGKPVEVQALWLNALWIAGQFSERWKEPFLRSRESFAARFWNEQGSYLYDVVDVDHQPGKVDELFRPNQILAIGGLPIPLIGGERAKRIVEAVTQRLWTPLGLRSLAPEEPDIRCGMKAACESATAFTTKEPSGPGLSVRLSRPGCAFMARAMTLSTKPERASSCR